MRGKRKRKIREGVGGVTVTQSITLLPTSVLKMISTRVSIIIIITFKTARLRGRQKRSLSLEARGASVAIQA